MAKYIFEDQTLAYIHFVVCISWACAFSHPRRARWCRKAGYLCQSESAHRCTKPGAGRTNDQRYCKFNPRTSPSKTRLTCYEVDFERSDEEGRTVVRVRVSDELDEQRRLYDGIDSLLSHTAREIATTIPEGLPLDLNVVYLPQIGFLITMPMDPETGRSMWEGTEDDVWEKMFSSETNVYYKNRNMHEMDIEIGDVWNDICGAVETRILSSGLIISRQGNRNHSQPGAKDPRA